MVIFVVAAMDCIEERGLQFFGNWAALTSADTAPVDFAYGCDFSRRA